MIIEIAVGRSREETNWKNKKIEWTDLLNKLKQTHRTAETYREYMAAPAARQDEIKDVGGFVGGVLTGGRRKNSNLLYRQLITLDIDHTKVDLWEKFTLLYGCKACVYSTHKHSSNNIRIRIIIPLNRPVKADEYQAISRKLAEQLDINAVDPVSFRPVQLMYWPSTSKDGEFLFDDQQGDPLSADEVLGMYQDWTDSSQWALSDREHKAVEKGIKKQGDPLDKTGIIGAFCRTYSIQEAIQTFLDDIYESADDNRFTYKAGSTSGGLVVYDDKYAFSHHSTDIISGKLVNAFDLVRLHLFGLQDEDIKPDTAGTDLPSYKAMIQLCIKDKPTKKQLGHEKLEQAGLDFKDVEGSEDWIDLLQMDGKGKNYLPTIGNVAIILEHDPNLKGCFGVDEFKRQKVILKDLPWGKGGGELKDTDEQNLVKYLEKVYGISSRLNIKDALDTYIADHGFHPVRDYLHGLQWDGKKRLDRVFIDYFGAADDPYTRAVTRKAFTAAVARVMEPGIKYDYLLVLVGEQGTRKSTFFHIMGRDKWFSDSFSFAMLGKGNQAYEQLQGAWLIEISELSGFRKSEIDVVKHFITQRKDTYRPAYGRNMVVYHRQNIFFGSTNNWDFLKDPTGNRRFWPVVVGTSEPYKDVFKDLAGDVNQLWAEAYASYIAGEELYLDKEMEIQANTRQVIHSEQDSRIGMILEYLDTLFPENWDSLGIWDRRTWLQLEARGEEGGKKKDRICAIEIWAEVLAGDVKYFDKNKAREINDILRSLPGWKYTETKHRFKNYGQQRSWVRIGTKKEKAW